MKILLTGRPGSGKTTLLQNFIDAIPNKQGFVTKEVVDTDKRTGFELVSADGKTAILASIYSGSKVRVSKYGVEVGQLDEFLSQLPPVRAGNLIYVDEIGQMELRSDTFKELVTRYLNMDNLYVGTITSVYRDDFTHRILGRGDIVMLTIDPTNRDRIQDILSSLAKNIPNFEKVGALLQQEIACMAKRYSDAGQLTSLKKLFNNAIRYVAEHRVDKLSNTTFSVDGTTRKHQVIITGSGYTCDCDLYNGRGAFADDPGECSHIQAVMLLSVS
jgi:nucleoside-triphosphatase